MMVRLFPIPELGPAQEAAAAALFAPLASLQPSAGAAVAARARLLQAAAEAGPVVERPATARRLVFAGAAGLGALAAVGAVGAITGQDELRTPVTVIERVAEQVGMKDKEDTDDVRDDNSGRRSGDDRSGTGAGDDSAGDSSGHGSGSDDDSGGVDSRKPDADTSGSGASKDDEIRGRDASVEDAAGGGDIAGSSSPGTRPDPTSEPDRTPVPHRTAALDEARPEAQSTATPSSEREGGRGTGRPGGG